MFFFSKWPPVAILDVQKSLLTISDQYPFWMSEIHFLTHFWPFQIDMQLFYIFFYKMTAVDHISGHFRSIRNFIIFDKMAAVGHFGCPKFTFDRISGHFR